MKLVEILARDLKVWPKNRRGNDGITQDKGGHLNSLDTGCEPSFHDEDKCWEACSHSYLEESLEEAEDFATAIVTKDQWQAERDRQKGGEWKRHRGGKQPVADGVLVEVKLRDGDIQQHYAEGFAWPFTDCDVDANILKYRVISQPQAEEVEVHKLIQDIGVYSHQGEIIHGPISISDELIAPAHPKWGQVDGPLLWRDTVNELDAYIEEFTRERESLIERLAEEGFALIPPVFSVMSEFSGADMSDWRNWRVGDVFENIGDCMYFTKGKQYIVNNIEYDYAPIKAIDDDLDEYSLRMDEVKFIRRP